MTRDEKYTLLLSSCRVVHQIAQRITTIAYSMTMLDSSATEEDIDKTLDMIAPYLINLVESEDGLPIGCEYHELVGREYGPTYEAMIKRATAHA